MPYSSVETAIRYSKRVPKMKAFQPQELATTLDDLATPYPVERRIINNCVVPCAQEVVVHETNLADGNRSKDLFTEGLRQKIAVKAISGTLRPPECARLLFESYPEPDNITKEDAALIYGAMRHTLMNQPTARSVFASARRLKLLDEVAVSNNREDPGGIMFSKQGKTYEYMRPSQPGVPGKWLAVQEAVLDAAPISLTAKPLHIPLPALKWE